MEKLHFLLPAYTGHTVQLLGIIGFFESFPRSLVPPAAAGAPMGPSQAPKFWPQQANGLFYQGDTEIGENLHFFIKRSAPENFQRGNFSKGVPTESLRTRGSEYVY